MSITVDSIGPKHGTKVGIRGLSAPNALFSSPTILTASIVSSAMYAGSISYCSIADCEVSLVTTTTQYALDNLVLTTAGQEAITNCYCAVTTTVLYPYLLFSMTVMLDEHGQPYPTPVFISSQESVLPFKDPLPVEFWPQTDLYYSVPIDDFGTPVFGALRIATTGMMSNQ